LDKQVIELVKKLRASFSDDTVKKLLINNVTGDFWYKINANSTISSTGFCYLASEVIYKLTGGAKRWWFKELISDAIPNQYHYFLQDKKTGEIVDPTADQFQDIQIPYHLAKNKGKRFTSKNCNALIKILNE
jgi:hypothetical protein